MSRTTEEYIEKRVSDVGLMIDIYCRKNHGTDVMCPECRELWSYAEEHIRRCPNSVSQIPCSKCGHSCYGADRRELMDRIVLFSRPRMLNPFVRIRQRLFRTRYGRMQNIVRGKGFEPLNH